MMSTYYDHSLVHTQVAKERIRVLEFLRDYDKLRSYCMPGTSFRRALDLCGFNLTEPEAAAVEERYGYVRICP